MCELALSPASQPTGIALGLTGVCHKVWQRLLSSAARASRSYVCFGPIIPVGFARERLGACLNIAPYKQGARAVTGVTGPKQT